MAADVSKIDLSVTRLIADVNRLLALHVSTMGKVEDLSNQLAVAIAKDDHAELLSVNQRLDALVMELDDESAKVETALAPTGSGASGPSGTSGSTGSTEAFTGATGA